MAIYHLSVQVIGRAQGRSVVNAAAYRAAEKLYDEHLGRTFSYERKEGVEHSEILAPEGAPDWVTDRAKLWNRVEAAENRKDAQLARELNVALPRELTDEQQLELVREYARSQFVSRGMVADVCIHRDNPEHPHAHIMLTTRSLEADGFGPKVREWNRKEALLEWRAQWAAHANRALERAGVDARIDHRSYREQRVYLEPQSKIGRARGHEDGRDIVRERMAEHEEIARRNGERIIAEPRIALEALTHQHSTFTRAQVGRWLNTRTADAEQFQRALDQVMASAELVRLEGANGEERFTTKAQLEVESHLVVAANVMSRRRGHAVSERHQTQSERYGQLTEDQRRAFAHIVGAGDVAVVQGHAGTGKSFMLGAAREAWEAGGYRVRGAALAGKAAEGLQVSAGIESRSLHAWEHAWREGREQLTSRDVLVIDEAGMVGSRQLERVLSAALEAHAKVVLVGDSRQLQAIEAGGALKAIGERVGQATMEDIRRQAEGWQKQASRELAAGHVAAALDAYSAHGSVHEHAGRASATAAIVRAWDAHRREAPTETQIMLAYRRVDVAELNKRARGLRRLNNELGPDQAIATDNGPLSVAVGDRIYFRKNDRRLGVMNGTLGTIEGLRDSELLVRLDDGRQVAFDAREYNHLDHGYAATAHRAQGVTVDRAHVLATGNFDQHAAYVALTRHRSRVDLHWSRDEFKDEAAMRACLNRERMKDVAVDYERVERQAAKEDAAATRRERAERVRSPAVGVAAERSKDQKAPEQRTAPARAAPGLQAGPAPLPDRYAAMDHVELAQHVRTLRNDACAPRSARDAFDALPEVTSARSELKSAIRQATAMRAALGKWRAEHPVRAKLGREPRELLEDAQRLEAAAAQRQADLAKVERDPALQQRAAMIAARSLSAQRELPAAEQALAAKRLERERQIGKELELEGQDERSFERGGPSR